MAVFSRWWHLLLLLDRTFCNCQEIFIRLKRRSAAAAASETQTKKRRRLFLLFVAEFFVVFASSSHWEGVP